MFKKFTNGCVNIVNKFLPDAFIFAVILTFIVFIAAWNVSGSSSPITALASWGDTTSFWSLLQFSMQMALVVVLGSAMANAKICKQALGAIASKAHDARSGIMITAFVSALCCFLNWGFGLIVGALLAKEVARRVDNVDYRLLIASAYSGFLVWHAGLSGSIPLTLAEDGVLETMTSGLMTGAVSTSETIFHPINLAICAVIIIGLPFLCWKMHPVGDKIITVNPELLLEQEKKLKIPVTPADKLEQSKILWGLLIIMGLSYIVYYFSQGGTLSLNIVNMIFLFVGLLLHGSLRGYVDAITDSTKTASGIILQFPFYAGIMGMMVGIGPSGVSLAQIISTAFVDISNPVTFPLLTFISGGIVNFFVPSGGGQWAVQGPIVMPAAYELGVKPGTAAMALAWGDAWTNMIQPFWALPALGVAGLSAKDIMGYCVVVLLASGLVIGSGLLVWAAFF